MAANLIDSLFSASIADLRNGAVLDILPIAITSSIDPKYAWILLPAPGGMNADAAAAWHSRSLWTLAEMYFVQLDQGPPGERAPNMRRRMAIAIAAVRSAIAANYRIVAGDLNPAERIICTFVGHVTPAAMAAANPPAGGPAAVPLALPAAGAHANPGPANTEVCEAIVSGVAVPAPSVYYTMITRPVGAPRVWTAPTAAEKEFAAAVYRLGAGIPVLNGVSLSECPHIFTNQTEKHFKGWLKQCGLLGSGISDGVRSVLETFTGAGNDEIKHVTCHTSPHPVLRGLMKALASDTETKGRMDAADAGAVAFRANPIGGAGKRAATMIAINANVVGQFGPAAYDTFALAAGIGHLRANGTFAALSGMSTASDHVRLALGADPAAALPAANPAAPVPPPAAVLERRHRYARMAMEAECKAAAPFIAYEYGFFKALAIETGIKNNWAIAPSVKNLCEEFAGPVGQGVILFEERSKYKRANPAAVLPPPVAAAPAAPAQVP